MRISYNWLSQYLPEQVEVNKLSKILTAVGLEVESVETFESIKGGLQGLVIGEVLTCSKHPNADKLSLTTVNIGAETPLNIVCGAANVAAGQKVVVAPIGATIYPINLPEGLTMEKRKIRGELSEGMICAEDEIGAGTSHDGIMVLPADTAVGTLAKDYFKPYTDYIFEIGLTPNHMDAQSHWGVAKNVCAYLSHHQNNLVKAKYGNNNSLKPAADAVTMPIAINILNNEACARYAGAYIKNIKVGDSPAWLKNYLQAIGLRSINNIVDITNYILHETGQPLHAFDADKIADNTVNIECLPQDTVFVSLDEKERKLTAEDIVICDGKHNPMCIGGVFGGLNSGVSTATTNIFLESAWFNPQYIRKTSMHHGLRTDAAVRFEKGVDVSNTVNVLKRAVGFILEIAGGELVGNITDVYPQPQEKTEIKFKYHFLKKLSGKNYHPDSVKQILGALEFEIVKEDIDALTVKVPYCKPDITMQADLVEEILRIDGLDNITIPTTITITPAVNHLQQKEAVKEKIANYLTGLGFNEILTNSITNSKYYSQEVLATSVKMINNLSADLDIMRPSLLETGLETISYNINRKNTNISFFELGKTYSSKAVGEYTELEEVAIYLSGDATPTTWQQKAKNYDFYYAKGLLQAIAQLFAVKNFSLQQAANEAVFTAFSGKTAFATLQQVADNVLANFDIKQPVFYININFEQLLKLALAHTIVYKEVSKFPAVKRDLALVLDSATNYSQIETAINNAKLNKLSQVNLFDIFESEKLGINKKSMALNFTFVDEDKTLTDKEIETMMGKLITVFEKELNAEVRK